MSVGLARLNELSQAGTPGEVLRAPAAQPSAEAAGAERRGPMRPAALTPTRSRLTGWMLGTIFRVADKAALGLIALSAASLSAGPLAPATLAPFLVGAATLIWALSCLHAYSFAQRETLRRHMVRLAAGFGLAALALQLLLIGFRPAAIELKALELWFLCSLAGLALAHGLWWALVRHWRAIGRLTPNVVIVGATRNAERLVKTALAARDAAVLGLFDDRADRIPPAVAGVPVLGDTEALIGHRIMPYVDKVVIAVPQHAEARVRQLIDRLTVLPNQVMLFIDQGPASREAALSRIAEAPLAPVSGGPSCERRAFVKRVQDLAIGCCALVAALPAMALIALAIKLDSPGPVLFRQRRHGFNNEEILVWKFRSMRHIEQPGPRGLRQVSADDERVTKVGRFIRRTSLDELPQLINVLKGEMSLVGPRPHAVGMKTGETESAKLVATYAHRHRKKPGMTGWAAIQGSRGPVDTPELVRRRVALDIEYIERQSLTFDLMILVRTIPCLIGDTKAVR
jgi:Undecaprenyl-phosphate glucose phosphotransferase